MMELRIRTQSTPNPNALKFIMNRDVKAEGKISFTDPASCEHLPLAQNLLTTPGIIQVHFFENTLTITQDGSRAWDELAPEAETVIRVRIDGHNPFFETLTSVKKNLPPELQEIDDILDRTIRPSLQLDGGDLQVTGKDGHFIKIAYEGACGGCPSSTSGTLYAIESVLREEYDPEAVVVVDEVAMADSIPGGYGGY